MMLIEVFVSLVLSGNPAGDFNHDGITDGRDVQAYVTQSLARADADPIARLKAHPNYLDVLAGLASYFNWPVEKWSESPNRMMQTVLYCAEWEAFTGEWPRPSDTRRILRRVRDEWPLPFNNFNHELTLWQIPGMYYAAKLSPTARAELEIPLRWCEARMLEPQLPFKLPTAIYSTSPGSGLRDMVMIREILYGDDSAREVALHGFGTHPCQWGLPRLIDECMDDYGLLRFSPAAFNHWAWTTRPALVWLLEVKGYRRHLTKEQRAKWRKAYQLPCRMLCVGGKTLTIPGVNDDYSMNPVVGPVSAWVGNTQIDKWARWHARRQGSPSFDWLMVPADSEGYVPPERPPGCKGSRDFGRVRLVEDKGGAATTVEYDDDSDLKIMEGHKTRKALTLEVKRAD